MVSASPRRRSQVCAGLARLAVTAHHPRMSRAVRRISVLLLLLLLGTALGSCDLGAQTNNSYQRVSNSIP